jgi:hypothetical protein
MKLTFYRKKCELVYNAAVFLTDSDGLLRKRHLARVRKVYDEISPLARGLVFPVFARFRME